MNNDFPIIHVPRLPKGRQKVVLRCPVVRSKRRDGWLEVRWNPRFARVQWDYYDMDCCYPECERFRFILQKSGWDKVVIRRLIEAGWHWEGITSLCMRWETLKGIPHELAQWILDTLPGVYDRACDQFSADCEKLSMDDWYLKGPSEEEARIWRIA